MSNIISDVNPVNLLSEKQKFFADTSYNPQFEYKRAINPDQLIQWGLPLPAYVKHAQQMLLKHPNKIPAHSDTVTEAEILTAVSDFNAAHRLEHPLEVVFSASSASRCQVTTKKITFQLPITYSRTHFKDLCRHELETHILRRLNHAQQPWGPQDFPDPEFRKTEEGLAGLHTFLFRTDKIITRSYLTYTAVALAQKLSFSEVFHQLLPYGISRQQAWRLAVRTKRGLSDTAQAGGLSKDICYFEGMVEVWQWLKNQEHDPKDLYLGRLGLDQIEAMKPQAVTTGLRYPSFFADLEQYRHLINEIGAVNNFENLIQ
ncbi:MAG TPA: tyrosine/phenylalanine carboxypeptidase domain-containing protein [Vitreimonas sp.]|nr:tyrosine/phenylalanine carboxypeptidase domain-containing protein [Vitreimonas sp.]